MTGPSDDNAAAETRSRSKAGVAEPHHQARRCCPSRRATHVYTLSHLVFFSLLGTLARLGLTALTRYLDAPVVFDSVWANFGGCLVMGFLVEDRELFRLEGAAVRDLAPVQDPALAEDPALADDPVLAQDLVAADKEAHLALKKTVPLYIGLATGFCGSFTSFSSFIRDAFLALSNDLEAPGRAAAESGRSGGQSLMALLAVIITTVSLSLSGLSLGAHLAGATAPLTPSLPRAVNRNVLDPLSLVLGWGSWLGAVLLSIWPPHDTWRGRAVLALALAPLGCLLRFYLGLHLNARLPTFPLGTFVANVAGCVVLAAAWVLAHSPAAAAVVACQVLQGVEDGFCGCLTTVSTWVVELGGLRRRDAYVYASVSFVVSFAVLVAVMGGLRWTVGFGPLACA